MYAIIHKNKVLIGPKGWNRAFFTYALNKVGISNALLPKNAAENLPLAIDEHTKIVKVMVTEDEFAPMIQSLRGPIWTLRDTDAIAHYEVENTPLELARNNFKTLAATERYKKENANIKITVQESELLVSAERDTRDRYAKKAAIMSDIDTAVWKFNETWLILNKAEFLHIASAIETHVQLAFDWEKSISDLIDAAQTAEELLAIEIVPTVSQQR